MPYFALRSYSDGGEHYDGQIGSEASPTAFLEALWAVTSECWRVLKPSGSLFVNLGDKYAGSGGHNNANLSRLHQTDGRQIKNRDAVADDGHRRVGAARRSAPDRYIQASDGIRKKSLMGLPARYAAGCVDGLADPCMKDHEHVGRHPAFLPSEQCRGTGWINRAEIIWSKPNGLPESVTDRVRRSHEQWFHLTKNGTYYADLDGIREPHIGGQSGQAATFARTNPSHDLVPGQHCTQHRTDRPDVPADHPNGKLPDDVWRIATQPLVVPADLGDHFAAFPTEWPRRLISAWCPPDGVVLDPFGGTGTTAMVARALGRYGVSIDLSADYLRLADWRIWDSGQDAKVARRTAEQTTDPTAAEAAFTASARLEQPNQLDIFAAVSRD